MIEESGHRILVVEGDPATLRELTLVLSEAGHTVIPARDSLEAVRFFRDSGADLVILDLLLPDKVGLETIVELRASDPGINIIAMSGVRDTRVDLLEDARMLGAAVTIEKPFQPAEVVRAVRRALGDAE